MVARRSPDFGRNSLEEELRLLSARDQQNRAANTCDDGKGHLDFLDERPRSLLPGVFLFPLYVSTGVSFLC